MNALKSIFTLIFGTFAICFNKFLETLTEVIKLVSENRSVAYGIIAINISAIIAFTYLG